jgi:hypothetical protein
MATFASQSLEKTERLKLMRELRALTDLWLDEIRKDQDARA